VTTSLIMERALICDSSHRGREHLNSNRNLTKCQVLGLASHFLPYGTNGLPAEKIIILLIKQVVIYTGIAGGVDLLTAMIRMLGIEQTAGAH